jgi:hypothetical protein
LTRGIVPATILGTMSKGQDGKRNGGRKGTSKRGSELSAKLKDNTVSRTSHGRGSACTHRCTPSQSTTAMEEDTASLKTDMPLQ